MPSRPSSRLPRCARLRLKRHIDPLFSRDNQDVRSLATGCVRVVYRTVPRGGEMAGVLAGFAAGRNARKAVDRNRVKRYLREVFRIHQNNLADLFSTGDRSLTMMVLFRGRPDEAQTCIKEDLPRLLDRLCDQLKEAS